MAEWPELEILRREVSDSLVGRRVTQVEALQGKCLNVSASEFVTGVLDQRIDSVQRVGKWLVLAMGRVRVAICPGMGFDLWHYDAGAELPAKYQLRLGMDDGTGFTCRFWWFGYIRLLTEESIATSPEFAKLGPDPVALNPEAFGGLVTRGAKRPVKSLILEQDKLSGIGNAYAHDILWTARLHPLRKLGTLSAAEVVGYQQAIISVLTRARDLGGLEDDFYRRGGNHRNWEEFSFVGYKEGKPCPRCATPVVKLKTGPTTSFICPTCQAL